MKPTVVRTILAGSLLALAACAPTPAEGSSARKLKFAGESRTFLLHAPKVRAPKPALVLVLHGMNGSGFGIEYRTRSTFNKLANRDGFIVAYPDAPRGLWNGGHTYEKSEKDDVEYLAALIDSLSAEFGVDPKRVFVTGFSNGASMAYRLACERPDKIAAIAPVGGGLAERLMRSCAAASQRPIPLLVMHGTADPIARFDGGELEGNVQFWIRRNGCGLTPVVTLLPDTVPSDGTRTRVASYGNCTNGADVALYVIEGGGHHWPRGEEPRRAGGGREIRDFDAGIVIWDFFNKHPMPATE